MTMTFCLLLRDNWIDMDIQSCGDSSCILIKLWKLSFDFLENWYAASVVLFTGILSLTFIVTVFLYCQRVYILCFMVETRGVSRKYFFKFKMKGLYSYIHNLEKLIWIVLSTLLYSSYLESRMMCKRHSACEVIWFEM